VNYASELATELLHRCIEEEVVIEDLRIPLFINLALYAGDLQRLIQENLPTGLELAPLLDRQYTTVILDGANELPRGFIENGRWLTDEQQVMSGAMGESW
jgi:hypothetical protein